MRLFLVLVLGMLMILPGCINLSEFKIRNAKNQYAEGNYQTAFEEFGEVLAQGVDEPWLHYNMGNAAHMSGDFEQAQKSYSRALDLVPRTELRTHIEYNMGNSFYRIAEELEPSDLQSALKFYNNALLQYKTTIEQDANDFDAKFNYELTQRKIEELMAKLEKQESSSDESSEDQKEEPSEQSDSSNSGQSETEEGVSEEQGALGQDEQNAQDEDISSDTQQQEPQVSEETEADLQDKKNHAMTAEEALMLLESMEGEEAERMNIYASGNLPEVEKDW